MRWTRRGLDWRSGTGGRRARPAETPRGKAGTVSGVSDGMGSKLRLDPKEQETVPEFCRPGPGKGSIL